MELTPDAVLVRTDVSESRMRYSAMHKAIKAGSYIFVYTSTYNAFFIPLRSFPTPAAADEFLREIQHRIATAKAAAPYNN